MSSEDASSQSDDELFNPDFKPTYETVDTLSLHRPKITDDDSDLESMATLPAHRPSQKQTQPTQLIRRSPAPMSSSPLKGGVVQVAASSPSTAPNAGRKSSGLLASAMAPAGTVFRRPQLVSQARSQPITIDSDDEGPVYGGSSSDSDRPSRGNDIKTSTFVRKVQPAAEKVPESPEGHNNNGSKNFAEVIAQSMFRASPSSTSSVGSSGIKRSADVNANAYGNASKRQRQTAPARALPIVSPKKQPEMELDDISDFNMRQKVKRMMSMVSMLSVRECYEVLLSKKGHYDDAISELLQMSETRHEAGKKSAIDLTGSEDELMPTPAARKSTAKPVTQQPKVPKKTIMEKWGSTQNVKKTKAIDVFDTPPPQKKRTLVRGRRHSSPQTGEGEIAKPKAKPVTVVDSDESDAAHSAARSDYEAETTFNSRLLELFNTCTAADLTDTASISREMAEHLVTKRPFKSLDDVRKIQDPKLKPTKGRRKVNAIGERIVDKVETMLTSYEAVDYLVKKCQSLAKPLADEMEAWGVNIYGSQSGEMDMVSLRDTLRSSHDSGIGTPVSDDDHDVVKKKNPKNFITQPSIMSSDIQMKDYQIVGINWLNLLYQKELSCILADDMGLGKTCQVIAFVAHLFEQGRTGPHLIVVPAATLENWLKEFKRFCPALNVQPYYSTNPSERVELREYLEDSRDDVNVIVTTYTLAKGKEDFPWLKTFGFDCTVYDEGHMLKNADSQVASKLVKIRSNFRLLLTGTPLQNNLKELISLLGFLMPNLFKEKAEELTSIFSHSVKAMDGNHEALLSEQRIKRARSMLTPFILRRKKYQVLKDLPKKERRVELCDMTPEQSEIYQMWLEKAYSIREQKEKGENVTNESTNILMKLRLAAIHPLLSRRVYPDKILPVIAKQCLKADQFRESNPDLIVTELKAYSDMEIHTLCDEHRALERFVLNNGEWMASGKVQKMVELLRKFMSEGHRTLIFSQFVMVLDILELVLEREAIDYFRLDGTTRVSERQDLIDEFSADDNHTPVFMLSTKAGGAGINLAKANKVIVFDSGFNPQDDIQAENRAHRIGQLKEVEVIRLVSRGTVEEQIHAMGLTKLKLDEQVAGDGSEEQPPKKEGEESETETEGRNIVEAMFFNKLNHESIEQVKAEVVSPVKKKVPAPAGMSESDGATLEGHDSACVKSEDAEIVGLPSRTKERGMTEE
ncbi:adenosinetriphosphatase [Exophiala viscosa]|uniref:adenosinetriphosphatase n=1 Tax=Exophiala viscosa TaxID=2486360 RepID=UPI0021993D31|nr:adenosinetriphosphatase [Exophiala viscosa]